jgi:predicted SnoaL-like aldol condensation-catalyzing enzyme
MDIHHTLEDGDLVCVFFKCTLGTNGMVNKVFDMYRVQDGKLAEHWDCVEHDLGSVTPVHPNGLF